LVSSLDPRDDAGPDPFDRLVRGSREMLADLLEMARASIQPE